VITTTLDLPGSYLPGVTHKIFWTRQVIAAVSETKPEERASLVQFINNVPCLAYERLPMIFYSLELWESLEAMELFVPSDLMPFQNYRDNEEAK